MKKNQPLAWWVFTAFALAFSLLVVPRIFLESPTNDEPVEITNGYYYWQGDLESHHRHPPFFEALQALPLRFLSLKDPAPPIADFLDRANRFFFEANRDRIELMLTLARFVTFLWGLGIGLLLFLALRAQPRPVAFTALALWAFEPNLCAFSSQAVADIPVAFFFLAAALAFQKHLEKSGARWACLSGVLAAMAVTCKFSALSLIPLFAFLEYLSFWDKPAKKNRGGLISHFKDWGWGTLGFLAWILFLYLPGTLKLPDHRFPLVYFLTGLQDMMEYSKAFHPTFFWGEATRQNHWLYYPAAFLLKSTLPNLALLFLCAILFFRKKLTLPLWIPISGFGFFLCVLPVQNLGVRYLLPAFPFFILCAAFAAGFLWKWKPRGSQAGKLILGGLLLWHAADSSLNFPHHLSYFNNLVAPEKKIYLLGDSNLDWGQDVKEMAKFAKLKDWKNIKLAQAAGVNPSLYGMKWESWSERDLKAPQPGWVYLMDVGTLQLAPVFFPDLQPLANSWVRTLTPSGWIGDTWVYFETPGKAAPDHSPALPHAQVFNNHALLLKEKAGENTNRSPEPTPTVSN